MAPIFINNFAGSNCISIAVESQTVVLKAGTNRHLKSVRDLNARVETTAYALVCRGCPPPPTGSLRRTRQSTRNAFSRVAAYVPTTGPFTTVTVPNFDTVPQNHRYGFPCYVCFPMCACYRQYPGGSDGSCLLITFDPLRLSPGRRRVSTCVMLFEECSTLTHFMACTLTEPLNGSLHRRLQRLRYLHRCFNCYRVERTSSRAGLSPAEKQRLSRCSSSKSFL